jgi:acyl carrier protein
VTAPPGPVEAELRRLLAEVTGRSELLEVPAGLPLFSRGAGLDSLTGTLLLRAVKHRFGVDVAAEDLNLDALASLAALTSFVAERADPAAIVRG